MIRTGETDMKLQMVQNCVKTEKYQIVNIQKKMTVEVLISCFADFVFMCGNITMKSWGGRDKYL